MRIRPAWLFVLLLAVSEMGAARPEGRAAEAEAQLKELRRLVAEGKDRVRRLESQWHEREPGIKRVADRSTALRELDNKITDGRYRVRNYINLEKALDPEIGNKFEQLKLNWKAKAAADLAADPVTQDVMKFAMTWDANRMKEDAENLKRLKPELKQKDLSTAEAYWSAAKPVLIQRGEEAVKEFDVAAKPSGFPAWALVQAKRETEVNAGETLEAYLTAKTPKELHEAREELKRLEGRLAQAEFERQQRERP